MKKEKTLPAAEPILYFAYGSNLHPQRMKERCPGAVALGHAVLPHYRLAERLYADIDMAPGAEVHGVLYLLTPRHLALLDRYEGYPQIYRRSKLDVRWRDHLYSAITYEMAPPAKLVRRNLPFPMDYRKICSDGADFHRIPNAYSTIRKGKKS